MRTATPPLPDPGDPPDANEHLDQLVAACLDLFEERGPGAVDEFLSAHPQSSEVVRNRLQSLGRLGLIGDFLGETLPERIGPYRVVRQLGRGGMGVVFEAEREHPRRRVALKVLRSTTASRQRFRQEVELLGRLQHPGIAAVYEAGAAELGGVEVPYFTMELVNGAALDSHCANCGLDARARLELLAQVVDAVHYAHQRGVVHRDLKPANVLVDETGAPRVVDFGVARAVDPDLSTLATHPGQLVGTLAYMSPEQAAGRTGDVGTPSDVYSLGVIAYELLAGRRPHALEGLAALEVLRTIAEVDPPRLGSLAPAFKGDVETIVAKALEKDPARRYASANELAADIRRYLNDEPISARPATATDQFSRFARRHKLLVGMSALVLLTLVLGLFGTARGLHAAERGQAAAEAARERALERLAQAEAVLDFQESMLRSPDPAADGREVRVVDVLDRSVLGLQSAEHAPHVEAALRRAAGEAYLGLGLTLRGAELLEDALFLFESPPVADREQALLVDIRLTALRVGSHASMLESEARLRELEAEVRRELGDDHPAVIEAQVERAYVLYRSSRYEQAAALAGQLAEHGLVAPETRHQMLLRRSQALGRLGRMDEGLAVAREAYEAFRDLLGPAHPKTLWAQESYGQFALDGGDTEAGLAVMLAALDLRREHLGDGHPDTLRALANATGTQGQLGNIDEGLALGWEAYEQARALLGPQHSIARLATNNLATILGKAGETVEAVRLLEELAEAAADAEGPEHFNTLRVRDNLAAARMRLGEYERADEVLEDVLAIRRRTLGEHNPTTLHTLYLMGESMKGQRRFAEAAGRLREAVEGARLTEVDPLSLAHYLSSLGRILVETEELSEAADVFVEARALFVEAVGEGHAWVVQSDRFLGLIRDSVDR